MWMKVCRWPLERTKQKHFKGTERLLKCYSKTKSERLLKCYSKTKSERLLKCYSKTKSERLLKCYSKTKLLTGCFVRPVLKKQTVCDSVCVCVCVCVCARAHACVLD